MHSWEPAMVETLRDDCRANCRCSESMPVTTQDQGLGLGLGRAGPPAGPPARPPARPFAAAAAAPAVDNDRLDHDYDYDYDGDLDIDLDSSDDDTDGDNDNDMLNSMSSSSAEAAPENYPSSSLLESETDPLPPWSDTSKDEEEEAERGGGTGVYTGRVRGGEPRDSTSVVVARPDPNLDEDDSLYSSLNQDLAGLRFGSGPTSGPDPEPAPTSGPDPGASRVAGGAGRVDVRNMETAPPEATMSRGKENQSPEAERM
ncbi:MAG: hypothetical protein M1825_006379 [Sarcosagium campestre]|nr:MAG: hypothetical protein M1825_006379 [Sarcosagium campestre]